MKSTCILLFFLTSVKALPMTTYPFAGYSPAYPADLVVSIPLIVTLSMCTCQCYIESSCITGSYDNNGTCNLYSSSLLQNQLRIINNRSASVFTFPNRTVPLSMFKVCVIHCEILLKQKYKNRRLPSSGYLMAILMMYTVNTTVA